MNIYVEIHGERFPASITGRLTDRDWDDRESKAIKCEMTYETALQYFTDDVPWSIIEEYEDFEETIEIVENKDEEGNIVQEKKIARVPTTRTEVHNNSDYSIAGDIINHRDGTITVKMGKPTAKELLAMLEGVL